MYLFKRKSEQKGSQLFLLCVMLVLALKQPNRRCRTYFLISFKDDMSYQKSVSIKSLADSLLTSNICLHVFPFLFPIILWQVGVNFLCFSFGLIPLRTYTLQAAISQSSRWQVPLQILANMNKGMFLTELSEIGITKYRFTDLYWIRNVGHTARCEA